VYYNLDAQVHSEYLYEEPEELYEFYEFIGEGGFSMVYRAMFIPTGEIIAVKILKEDKETRTAVVEATIQEAVLLNKLDHPNVIKVKHLI